MECRICKAHFTPRNVYQVICDDCYDEFAYDDFIYPDDYWDDDLEEDNYDEED